MKQKSLVKNAIWNFLYSGLNIIFPLITTPYVSRILGATNLGRVDFARSIVQWFMIFAAFGITTYGVREISRVREDQGKMNKVFSELFTINFIFSIITTIIYFIFIFNNTQIADELPLFIVMSVSVILNAFNIDWFYQGIEEYSYITLRNGIIKLISIVSIFMFVNSNGDYIIYGLISVLGTSLSGILNVINSRKYVKYSYNGISPLIHLKSLWTFFFITLIISVYTNLDKTVLGFLDTIESVAYLTRVKMIQSVAIAVSSSIAAVAMPRASYYLSTDKDKYKKLILEIPNFMLLLTTPIAVGVMLLAPEIMFILGGEDFLPATDLLRIISITIIFSALSTFLQQQILVPSGNEELGLRASIYSSIVSLVANFILIPNFSYVGAGMALVLAEYTAMFTRYHLVKKAGFSYITFINSSTIKYFVASLSMFIPIFIIKNIVESLVKSFLLSACMGAIFYFVILLVLKEKIIFSVFKSIKEKVTEK